MKKRFFIFFLIFCMTMGMAGCSYSTSKAYLFEVGTGDSVLIEMETTTSSADGKYDIDAETPFTIYCDEEEIGHGIFVTKDDADAYIQVVKNDSKSTILDQGTKDNNWYIFWNYNDEEYNRLVIIGNSNTAILLGGTVSEEAAEESFARMTISLK